jgi:hypothetical protein
MPRKVMDVISDMRDTTPTARKAGPNPRDRPMYGRVGITMGQHLDEFAEYEDGMGRSFDQLVYNTLHRPDRKTALPRPQPQTGKDKSRNERKAGIRAPIAPPSEDKVDMDEYMHKLKYSHIYAAQRLMVERVEPREDTKRDESTDEKTLMQEIDQIRRPTKTDDGERKRPGAPRYF